MQSVVMLDSYEGMWGIVKAMRIRRDGYEYLNPFSLLKQETIKVVRDLQEALNPMRK